MAKVSRPTISGMHLLCIIIVSGLAMLSNEWFRGLVVFGIFVIIAILGVMWEENGTQK